MSSELPPGFRLDNAALPAGFAKDEQSWGGYLGETAQDFARAGVNAATFGMSDRAAAALAARAGGRSYDEELAKTVGETTAARERSPYASIGGDVAGSVALPGFGAAGLAARMGGGALARGTAYGLTGAGVGAAQGAGNTYTGNPADYIENAAWGGVLGGAFGAAGGAAFGRRPAVSRAATPDAAELEAAKTAAYRTLEQHPAQYVPGSLAQRADDVEAALRARNIHQNRSPQSFETLEQMRAPPTATAVGRSYVTPADIDYVRKGVTGDLIAGASPTDQATARLVRRSIDDFMRNPPPGAAVPGTQHLAADAARAANRAHQMHAGFKRTQMMEELVSNASRNAEATHSGLNLRNELQKTIRNKLTEKGGKSQFSKAGYTADEIANLDRFSRGQGRTSQVLGYVDKYLGGGGGLGALGAGAVGGYHAGQYFKDDPSLGTVAGFGTSALGLGLRRLGNRRATADINRLRDMIAQRNPLYRERAAVAGTQPGPGSPRTAQAVRDAATLALLNQTMTQPRRLYMDMAADKSEWE